MRPALLALALAASAADLLQSETGRPLDGDPTLDDSRRFTYDPPPPMEESWLMRHGGRPTGYISPNTITVGAAVTESLKRLAAFAPRPAEPEKRNARQRQRAARKATRKARKK